MEAAGAGLRSPPPSSPSMVLCPWGPLALRSPFLSRSVAGGLGILGPLTVPGIRAAQGLGSRVGSSVGFRQLKKKSHRPVREGVGSKWLSLGLRAVLPRSASPCSC